MSKRSHHRFQASKRINRWHTISHEKLNELFLGIGWVGKRKVPLPPRKPQPFFDRGPGTGA